jgi:hypothetical protein
MTEFTKPRRRLMPACMALAAAAFAVAGCATATIESAVPAGALNEAQQPTVNATATDTTTPATSETFPNIGTQPQAATRQLTPADEKNIMKALDAAKASQGRPAGSSADTTAKVRQLREEAKRQVDDTLTTIEKE